MRTRQTEMLKTLTGPAVGEPLSPETPTVRKSVFSRYPLGINGECQVELHVVVQVVLLNCRCEHSIRNSERGSGSRKL